MDVDEENVEIVEDVQQIASYTVDNRFSNVNLVQPRQADDRLVVNTRQTDKNNAPDELVALASQLTMARELVKGRACDRLKQIAEQMEHLHLVNVQKFNENIIQAAKKVLEEAARDEELHTVSCNMQKQPGRVYHLYRRLDGYRYFSMLSPQEWQKDEKEEEFVGSFRLEYDRSWTPMVEAEERDRKYAQFQAVLQSGPSMLGWNH